VCLFHPLGNVQYVYFCCVAPSLLCEQWGKEFIFIFFYQRLPLLSINYPCHLLEDLLSSLLTSWTICSWKMSFYLSLSSCAIFLSFSTFAFLIIFLHSQLHPVIFPFPSVSDITYLAHLPWSFCTSLFRLIGLFNCCSIWCWMDSAHTPVDLYLEDFECALRFLLFYSFGSDIFFCTLSRSRRKFIFI